MAAMRRRLAALPLALALLALAAPAALAISPHDQGQGWYGLTTDRTVTYAGFILIAAFPLLILVLSVTQSKLDKRKDARKKAQKARTANRQWQGGW